MSAGDDLFADHSPSSSDDAPADPAGGTADRRPDRPTEDGAWRADAAASADDAPVDPAPTERIAPVDLSSTRTHGSVPGSRRPSEDPDATVMMPMSAPAGSRPRLAGTNDRPRPDLSADEVWDTGTIRRWDASQTDQQLGSSTGPVRRPTELDDREHVDVDQDGRGGGSRWYEIPVMVLTALTLAFLLRTFVVQVFYIPSGSMIPTLEVNDRIAVEKISYLTREPSRGEVIVFAGDDPLANGAEQSTVDQLLTGVGQFLGVVPVDAKDFVKRVIGLPGDTVQISDGQVSVNGVQLDEPYARLDNDDGEWEVPPGMLFVMGDNRANSGDSRTSLGYIPDEDVVGRAVFVIWPFDGFGPIPGEPHDVAVDAGS